MHSHNHKRNRRLGIAKKTYVISIFIGNTKHFPLEREGRGGGRGEEGGGEGPDDRK